MVIADDPTLPLSTAPYRDREGPIMAFCFGIITMVENRLSGARKCTLEAKIQAIGGNADHLVTSHRFGALSIFVDRSHIHPRFASQQVRTLSSYAPKDSIYPQPCLEYHRFLQDANEEQN
jgi:hypothetical protein